MKAYRLLILTVMLALFGSVQAQKLVEVEPVAKDPTLTSRSMSWKLDGNGEPCALLHIKTKLKNLNLEGDTIATEQTKDGYLVWMLKRSTYLDIACKGYGKLNLEFAALEAAGYSVIVEGRRELRIAEPLICDEANMHAAGGSLCRQDSNGMNCPLVEMDLDFDVVTFEGEVVDFQRWKEGNGWRLWLKPHSTGFVVNVPGFAPITVTGSAPDFEFEYSKTYTVRIVPGTDEYMGRWFVLANYAFSFAPQHSMGLTLGRAGRFGWYVNAQSNGSFAFTGEEELSGSADGSEYLWSGRQRNARLSVTAGGVLGIDQRRGIYAYAGVGYGLRSHIRYTQAGTAVRMAGASYSGLALEAGAMMRLSDHMLISAGLMSLELYKYAELKLGAGYMF